MRKKLRLFFPYSLQSIPTGATYDSYGRYQEDPYRNRWDVINSNNEMIRSYLHTLHDKLKEMEPVFYEMHDDKKYTVNINMIALIKHEEDTITFYIGATPMVAEYDNNEDAKKDYDAIKNLMYTR